MRNSQNQFSKIKTKIAGASGIVYLVAGLHCVSAAAAQTEARVEIPIREVALENGDHLYSVAIKVGNTEIEAGLDTGSSGLRVLPGTLAAGDAAETGSSDTTQYSSGVVYEGIKAKANVAIGGLSGPLVIQEVKKLSCTSDRPDCPAAHLSPSDIGVRSNSLTGGRFKAVLGINRNESDIPGALHGLGVKRWIIELPRPNEGGTGRLILEPVDQETSGYVRIRNLTGVEGSLRDGITGCIAAGVTHECGPMILDTGAPGIQIVNASGNRGGMVSGANAVIGFYSSTVPCAAETIVLGRETQSTQFRYSNSSRMRGSLIIVGTVPFFAFDVLYDNEGPAIGFRPRTPMAGGPAGQVLCPVR